MLCILALGKFCKNATFISIVFHLFVLNKPKLQLSIYKMFPFVIETAQPRPLKASTALGKWLQYVFGNTVHAHNEIYGWSHDTL